MQGSEKTSRIDSAEAAKRTKEEKIDQAKQMS